MDKKKVFTEKKLKNNSNSTEISKETFKRLEIILVVIYGTLITLILVTLTAQSVGPDTNTSASSIEIIALFLMGVFMVEECCNVIVVNSIKPYDSTGRFTVDVLAASIFYFTFVAIDNSRMIFIYFLGIIHFLNFLWALSLLKSTTVGPKVSEYFKLTLWTNVSAFVGCIVIIILSRIFKAEFWFETTLICYLIVYALLLFLPSIILNFRQISSLRVTDIEEKDPFISGPILTKMVFYILLFAVYMLKAIIGAVISFFRDITGK